MNQEESIQFIEMYKNYSILWDPKNKAHHNRAKREDAWKEISQSIQKPVSLLKSKIKTLMGSYRSEKSRENKSRVTGSGSENVYQSKWFAYKYFDFSKDKDTPVVTLDTITTNESQEVIIGSQMGMPTENTALQVEVEEGTNAPQGTTGLQLETEIRTTGLQPEIGGRNKEIRKRKRQENSDTDKMMGEALEILKLSTSSSNDPYFTYALNLANELKKYDAQTLAYVKRSIANILFEADMGRMSALHSYSSNVQLQEPYWSSSETGLSTLRSEITSGHASPAISGLHPLLPVIQQQPDIQQGEVHDSVFSKNT